MTLCDGWGCANEVNGAEYCPDHLEGAGIPDDVEPVTDKPERKAKKGKPVPVEVGAIYRIQGIPGRWRAIGMATPCNHKTDECWEFEAMKKVEKIPRRYFVASRAIRRYK